MTIGLLALVACRPPTPGPSPTPTWVIPPTDASPPTGEALPTPPACITPTPLPTPPAVTQPPCVTPELPPVLDRAQVLRFEADKPAIRPGEAITLRWETTGTLVHICQRGTISGDQCWQGFPPVGSHTVVTDEMIAEVVVFDLLAIPSHPTVTLDDYDARLPITVLCDRAWFFDNPPDGTCPSEEVTVEPGLAQHFEHGVMIENLETRRVFILYDDGSTDGALDTWEAGMPESDPALTPPERLYQPIEGLGLVWRLGSDPRHFPPLRERLGWATAPAVAIQTAYQCDWATYAPEHKPSTCWLLASPDVVVIHSGPEVFGWTVWDGG
jgi:hypothetical protein